MMEKTKITAPQLRFKEFDDPYKVISLGAIAKFSKGKNVSKKDIDANGVNECIRYGELYTVYNETINHIVSKTNLELTKLILSEYNDIIIPASGETQIDIATASCVLKDGVILGGDLNIIKTSNNGVYLSYYLNSKKKNNIARLSQGSSVMHLYSSQLALLKLTIPTLPEQQKIAAFLTAVDKKIEQLTTKKELLEKYKKGLMQQIFSQQLRFKPEGGSSYPDWEEKRLENLAIIKMGQSPDSKSYNSNGKGYPLIQGNADIVDRKSNPRNYTTNPTKLCDIGDLILTVRAPVGAISKSLHKACIGRGVCSIRNKNNSNIEYLYQFLLNYEDKWVRISQGSTFTAVNGNDLRNIKQFIPSLPEQTQIADFLSAIDKKIELVNEQIENTTTFKKGLLQKMFV